MKKAMILLLACSLVLLSFAACGSEPGDETVGNTVGNGSGNVSNDTTGATTDDPKGEYTPCPAVEYDPERKVSIGFRDMDSFLTFREMTNKTDSEIQAYFEEEFVYYECNGKEDMHYLIGIIGNIMMPDLGPEFQFDGISFDNDEGRVLFFYEKNGEILYIDSYLDPSREITADGEAFVDITVDSQPVTLYWNFSSSTHYVFYGIARGEGYLLNMKLPRMTADAIKADFPENIEVLTVDQYILKHCWK